MTIEEAIKGAIEFETEVRDVYGKAVEEASDTVGKRIFQVLAEEEQGHLDYLEHKLRELGETGRVTSEALETQIPSPDAIRKGVAELEERMERPDRGSDIEMLKKALDVEYKTSDFYRRMVDDMGPEEKAFFRRFLEIEEGHVAIVQAELDSLSGTGHWFDFREFTMED